MYQQKYLILPAQFQQVEPRLSIISGRGNSECSLFVEITPKSVSFSLINLEQSLFIDHLMYNWKDEQELVSILDSCQLMKGTYHKQVICWSFPETIWIPHEHFDKDTAVQSLELVFGDLQEQEYRFDFLYRHYMHNVWRIPKAIFNLSRERLPLAMHTHQYTFIPDILLHKGEYGYCIFYEKYASFFLVKKGQLKWGQSFAFTTPEDIAWRLLKACEINGLDPSIIEVQLAGMYKDDSALYMEIHKYFKALIPVPLPEGFVLDPAFGSYPSQLFSHIIAAMKCV